MWPSLTAGQRWLLLLSLLCAVAGLLLLSTVPLRPPAGTPAPGAALAMTDPAFAYSPGWSVDAEGADPAEPPDPWTMPAGVITFTYGGGDLALNLAQGDYWAYLFVTVDGAPANALPVLRGNHNSLGRPAGYRPLYAPELQTEAGSTPAWVTIHRLPPGTGPHAVRIELWRGWGQRPIRGVAVASQPPAGPLPAWPGAALLVAGAWLALLARPAPGTLRFAARPVRPLAALRRAAQPFLAGSDHPLLTASAAAALLCIGLGAGSDRWLLALGGAAFLALAGLARPTLWLAALLFGLPFWYEVKLPLLPQRAFSLIDLGLLGGLALLAAHRLLAGPAPASPSRRGLSAPALLLAAIVSWSFVALFAASRFEPALREWRTVFLSGGLFALLLVSVLRLSPRPAADRRLLLAAWLLGGAAVAALALGQAVTGSGLIEAEGVRRVRGFYGSPNNLAAYLERTLAVSLALALFLRPRRSRLFYGALAAVQGIALLLTFSKGALFLGLPALLVVLWLGGWALLRRRGELPGALLWLAGAALAAGLALLPFVGAERFQRLLDFSQGTGFLRLNLWRSSWQMALDHPFFGVGPDNFLYTYRSGYILPAAWMEPNLNHPHNWLLDWWTRLGLVGLALGLGWWAAGAVRLWRRVHTPGAGDAGAAAALGLLAAAAAALAHGLIDVSYALPDLMLVWVLLFFLMPGEEEPAAALSEAG